MRWAVSGHELLIVGAGPAGVSTALSLVHARPDLAAKVLVVDKCNFPRDKYCAGALGMRGERLLRAIDAMPDVPSRPFDGIRFRGLFGHTEARLAGIGRVVRRVEFDHALVKIARARGIDIEEGTSVLGVATGDDSVGVMTSRGLVQVSAVLGADGVGSVVRRAMGLARGALRAQVLEVDTELLPHETDLAMVDFDAADPDLPGYYWDFPTVVDGRTMMCRGVYKLMLDGSDGTDIRERFALRLAAMGLTLDAYKNKRYAERGLETLTKVGEGRLLLAGEAAGIDPATGEGIAQAIEYGTIAGAFLAERLAPDARDIGTQFDAHFRTTRLYRDLRIRERFARRYYGPQRNAIDRFFVESDAAIHVGCQHFANEPYDRLKLAEAGARAVAHGASAVVDRLLRGRQAT
jgi:flavin-dependent dehydrogenase